MTQEPEHRRGVSEKGAEEGRAGEDFRRGDLVKTAGRNDPCPCGSGRKFKKCHWGREDEIPWDGRNDVSVEEMGARIAALPSAEYGRSRAMADALDLKKLTGREIAIRFLDLKTYAGLGLLGTRDHDAAQGRAGGLMVNPLKTAKADPDHVYIAISPDIDDSTLIHELAHAITYLGSCVHDPGTLDALGFEMGIPVDHLDHPDEFGYWLEYLSKKFDVLLDADDSIILFLYRNGHLLKSEEIRKGNGTVLRAKSERIFRFLSEKSGEINVLIRERPGYIGPRDQSD